MSRHRRQLHRRHRRSVHAIMDDGRLHSIRMVTHGGYTRTYIGGRLVDTRRAPATMAVGLPVDWTHPIWRFH